MKALFVFLILLPLVTGVFCLFVAFRNDWVYRKRVALLHTDQHKYDQLPSYDYMFWRFWIWDIERFLQ